MMMTDPIADMFTRIRNAYQRNFEKTTVPASRIKVEILKVLKQTGYIKDFKSMSEETKKNIHVYLKYTPTGDKIITRLKRISTPGRRVYRKNTAMGRVLDGLGIAVISTSKGVMSDKECRKLKLGGEVLCEIW
ncbi:MAG: 30S ribosomal protein S8 [Planctomycetes bacterium]|nr:30S ribosomal protein S8 [Planctomycetota bacterium]